MELTESDDFCETCETSSASHSAGVGVCATGCLGSLEGGFQVFGV